MELSRNRRDLTDDKEYQANVIDQSASCLLSNISEADKVDADDESEKGKRKLRKKARFSERSLNKIRIKNSSQEMETNQLPEIHNPKETKKTEQVDGDENFCNCPVTSFSCESK